jgi:DNA polymerase-3 subunit alpha
MARTGKILSMSAIPSLSASPAVGFVHLRLHSEHSVVDGVVRIDDAVARARATGMPALAITDLANLFAAVRFYQAARGKGIKPILGVDAWVGTGEDAPARLLLLAKDHGGYLRLCAWLTRAWLDHQSQGRALIDPAWFQADGTDGLIALSGAAFGAIGQALCADNLDAARQEARTLAALFPGRFYLEVQRIGRAEEESLLEATLELAAELGLPVVATHPVQFMDADDFKAHEARVCIAEGGQLGDARRARAFTEAQYFKTGEEMATLFADLPEALENSVEIARRCNLTLTLGKSCLPLFPTPEGRGLDDFIRDQAEAGLGKRLAFLYPDAVEREAALPRYRARLDHELATIVQMGFPGYFLIVADFIDWSKHNGVPVGPGRGSGAGSLVAYSLGITDLDPLKYDLLFERFLNPERVSMPDFDIDFCQEGRDRVIDYVKRKYGAESVSQIATFGTLAAKAVVRDVGRVLGLSYGFVDKFAKLIPAPPGKTVTLRRRTDPDDRKLVYAREVEPQIEQWEKDEEEIAELLTLAEKLEGITRNVGMHAGGVLIAPGKLTDFCPLYRAEGSDAAVSQFDKDDVEAAGLVKFDFLGLRTLTILDEAVRFARRAPGMEQLRLEDLPLDDAATYKLFSSGDTTAVFQFESRGMRDLLRQARPDRFEDLIALVALYRPGPMDLIPDFNARKHGQEKVVYLDPRLEPILGATYGVMIYQEQVMQIAQELGGYTLGGADLLRRAMGKKKAEEMAEQRQIFVAGALDRGVTEPRANQIFDQMEKFAGYGFNKSHAAAYALIAYHTAWLKAHWPAQFMAATMSSEMADTDKVRMFIEDCKASDIAILPPDINASGYRFEPVDAKQIRYGLGAIKGTGEAAIGAIVKARADGGPFTGMFDLARRVDKRTLNRRVLEALVKAGAFDSLNDHRAALLASIGLAMELAEQAGHAQNSLFGEPAEASADSLVAVARWPEPERLMQEKSALGLYLTGHPFNSFEKELGAFIRKRLDRLEAAREPQWLAGIVVGIRTQMSRRGKMAILTLDDTTAPLEVVVFNELLEQHRDWLKEDVLAVVEGKVSRDDYAGGSGGLRVTADKLLTLEQARTQRARALKLTLNGASSAPRLKELLDPFRVPGDAGCAVRLTYRNAGAQCEAVLGDAWRVRLTDPLIATLGAWLAPENVEISYG